MTMKRRGGQPPVEHQFKPGQSGNPGGRPKGRRSLRERFLERLERQVWVTVDGERKQVALIEALLDKHLTAADEDSFLQYLKWGEPTPPPSAAPAAEDIEDDDAAILAAAFAREAQRRALSEDAADE